MNSDKTFAFFNIEHLHLVNFYDVLESSVDTLRKSVDGKETFVKWVGQTPSCIPQIPDVVVLSYDDAISLLKTSHWHVDPESQFQEISDTNIAILE